jgi:hypothetical protein
LAKKVNLRGPKTTAAIRFLNLQADADCYKKVTVGKATFDRYSQKAIGCVLEGLKVHKIEDMWTTHGIGMRKVAK